MSEKKYKGKISELQTKYTGKGKNKKISRVKIRNAKNTKLTVLITAYNHESSVAKCIESVLEQNTKYPYEIWILEDCSTDGTLKICEKYAIKYSDRIKLINQEVNTKGLHASYLRKNVKSDYLTVLEADDQWCDINKIQTALDILEKKTEYVMFAHDTTVNDVRKNKKYSLVHDVHKKDIYNPVIFEDAILFHMSSRIYRNVIDLEKNPIRGDIFIFYSYLDRGPLHYHDKVMSIYNSTGNGVWSSLNPREQTFRTVRAMYRLNKMFDYRYDRYFSKNVKSRSLEKLKQIFGTRLGWMIYIAKEKTGRITQWY